MPYAIIAVVSLRSRSLIIYLVLSGNIQFDDPLLAYFCADSMIKGMEELGIDHEKILSTYIKAYQDCLKGKPKDMNAGLHLCRGNFRVRFHPSRTYMRCTD